MRILIVAHGYPPTHFGGAELRAERTARALLARGHEVAVLCVESASAPYPDMRAEDREQDGILVRRLYFDLGSTPDPFRWSYDNPDIGAAAARFIEQWRPSIVHLFSGYLTASRVVHAGAEAGVPVVVSLTDYWWLCHRINLVRPNGERCDGPSVVDCARCSAETRRRFRTPARVWPAGADRFWDAAERLPVLGDALGLPRQAERVRTVAEALGLVDALVAPSQYLADMYQRFGVNPERLRVWRQGVNLSACPIRRPSPALRVGYVGQVKPHKGVHTLLEAWGKLAGPRSRSLTLYGSDAGEAAYGARLRRLIAGLDGVLWAGSYRGAEVWDRMAELDVLVVPSRWVENSPNTILEAQAMGVPIVGTNLGGVAELVQHERNGLLFTVDDADDLARQIQRLLDEPDLLARLRRSPIPFKTTAQAIDELEGLYAELLATRGEQPPHPAPATDPRPVGGAFRAQTGALAVAVQALALAGDALGSLGL